MTYSTAAVANPLLEFLDVIAQYGIVPTERIVPDSEKIQRFHVQGDRRGTKNGWCRLHLDERPAAAFGCHKRYPGQTITWRARDWYEVDPVERSEWLRVIEAKRARRDAAERAATARAAARARREWARASAPDPSHPYLLRKNVGPHGIRQMDDRLIVPVRNIRGRIQGLQYISPDGFKRFKAGTSKAGHYHAIGRLQDILLICEGFATGATLFEVTGHAVAVAFDAGNLAPVAVALRGKYPNTAIFIAGDNDHHTDGNPGKEAAEAAAAKVGGRAVLPDFEAGDRGSDWNDYAAQHGVDRVTELLRGVAS